MNELDVIEQEEEQKNHSFSESSLPPEVEIDLQEYLESPAKKQSQRQGDPKTPPE